MEQINKINMDANKIKEIINKHDPVGLISSGAPKDEYLPEAQAVLGLFAGNKEFELEEIEQKIKSIFVSYFSEEIVNENVSSYKKIAIELSEMLRNQ